MAVSVNINVNYTPTGGKRTEQPYSGEKAGWIGCFSLALDNKVIHPECLNEPEAGYVYTTSGKYSDPSIFGWNSTGLGSGRVVDITNVKDLSSKYSFRSIEVSETAGGKTTITEYTARNLHYTVPTNVTSVIVAINYLPTVGKFYVPNQTNNAVTPNKIYVPDKDEKSKQVLKMYVGDKDGKSIQIYGV